MPNRIVTGAAAALAATAALGLAVPAEAAAQHRHRAPAVHHWARGQHFDRYHAPNYAVIDYRRYHRLHAPPRGYRWVRSGDDAVLVAISTGIIASVIAGALR